MKRYTQQLQFVWPKTPLLTQSKTCSKQDMPLKITFAFMIGNKNNNYNDELLIMSNIIIMIFGRFDKPL